MSNDLAGVVSERDGKLILTASTKAVRDKLGNFIDILVAGRVDAVEITNHGTVVAVLTAPKDKIIGRLPVGEYKFT